MFAPVNQSPLVTFILPYKAVFMLLFFFYFKPLVTPLFIQLFCNIIYVSSKNEEEDLMKTVQLLYNNNINDFLYSRIKEVNIKKYL